ncbi:cyclase family protein [Uliginosibacterium sediminicola]|uniref:Cyclase family protein n=1 Tax=Uliginosibacterium sediminicola TaxID=2024550 RepID=A0ABU9YX63_9RHOO
MKVQRFVDLSVALDPAVASDPPGLQPQIDYIDHQTGARHLCAMFPGLRAEDLPDGEGWAVEDLRIHTHCGTHMDAPWHYASTMDGGKPAMPIDEVPLDWCFRPGVKLDFRAVPDGHVVSAAEIAAAFEAIEYRLAPFDIVLINTSAGAAYGQPDYINRGCGLGREATLWLLERGVRVVGTDAWSWDAPFAYTRQRYAATADPRIIWEGHKAGREMAYCQMEKLAQLDQLPAHGFMVSCFPYKIRGASAGFTRCVALFLEEVTQ